MVKLIFMKCIYVLGDLWNLTGAFLAHSVGQNKEKILYEHMS